MLYDAKGRPLFTLLDVARRVGPTGEDLRKLVDKLASRNPFLQDAPWRPMLYDQFGREIK